MATKVKVTCDLCHRDITTSLKPHHIIMFSTQMFRESLGNDGSTRDIEYDTCDNCYNAVTAILDNIRDYNKEHKPYTVYDFKYELPKWITNIFRRK